MCVHVCVCAAVWRVARRCGLQPVVGEGDDWTVYWTDTPVVMEKVMEKVMHMKRHQVSQPLTEVTARINCNCSSAENQPLSWDGSDLP